MPITIFLPPGGGHHVIFDSIEAYSSYFMRSEKEVRQLDVISGGIIHCRIYYPADGSFTPFEVFRLLRKLVPEYNIPVDRYIVSNASEDVGADEGGEEEDRSYDRETQSNASRSTTDLSDQGKGDLGSCAGIGGYFFSDFSSGCD